jgi:hypothetical protein
VGSHRNGNIYEMTSEAYDDDGDPLVSVRTTGHIRDRQKDGYVFIHRLALDMETGVGDAGSGADPRAALSWSDDGGHTWSFDYTTSMGPVGAYRTRAVWRRLGCARDRIFRIAISDPVKRVIVGADIS